ncbi:gliding motility protein [Chondromyces crocatus]|uniref:Gliding motility protein n=1 Tax=Chondromyces crocatus TaxID=52 RepID=A0A0K1EFT7_CHOCO|nr:GTPase domain-containing protein [Chondromyces crocatus]AKT39731.1 gliding motility protein [Chondromyces crocatus]
MASVNPLSRELVFKVVYYGPGLGGKTTTLEYLHRTTKPEHRGKLVSLATPVDRTLYFDFLPVRLPPVRGMNVRLQLFTVPGQVYFNATRKLVLTGADGIVFVSDSQSARADANLESLENLRENLAEQGRELGQIPLVFQHNKRDLPDLLSIEDLDEMLNPFNAISVPASARTGLGVFEGLEIISERVLRAFEQRLPEEVTGFGATFDAIEGGLVTALRDASPQLAYEPVVSRVSAPHTTWSSMPPNATIEEPVSEEAGSETLGSDALSSDALSSDAFSSEAVSSEAVSSDELSSARTVIPDGNELFLPRDDAGIGSEDDLTSSYDPIVSSDENDLLPLPGEDPPETATGSLLEDLDARASSEDDIPPSEALRKAAIDSRRGVSFALLWPPGERELCADVESAIAGGQYARAILRADALLLRLTEHAADLFGATHAARDPAVIPLLLGLDGRRYLAFRALTHKAQAGAEISARDALSAFGFVIGARLAQMAL